MKKKSAPGYDGWSGGAAVCEGVSVTSDVNLWAATWALIPKYKEPSGDGAGSSWGGGSTGKKKDKEGKLSEIVIFRGRFSGRSASEHSAPRVPDVRAVPVSHYKVRAHSAAAK